MPCLKELLKQIDFMDLVRGHDIDRFLLTDEEAEIVIGKYKELLTEEESPELLYNLGCCYRFFSGISPDYKHQALVFLRKAAERGNTKAQELIEYEEYE